MGAQTLLQASVRAAWCVSKTPTATPGACWAEVWHMPAGDARTAQHARLHEDYRRHRTFRAGKAMACLNEAARLEREAPSHAWCVRCRASF